MSPRTSRVTPQSRGQLLRIIRIVERILLLPSSLSPRNSFPVPVEPASTEPAAPIEV